MNDYVIEMRNITKRFPGITANDNVTLQLQKGEIHALLGENGAGKSTLMSVLFGMYQPDEGELYVKGEKVKIKNPNDANRLGIGMVHQHFMLVENFTVLENIILGVESTKKGFLDMETARGKVEALSKKYGLQVELDQKIEDITVGMQQRVEILKMLYRDNDILIFDEPTAVLTPQEIEELIHVMKGLAAEGKTILFITHKLDEIKSAADRCSVLRKGKMIGCVNVKDTSKELMSEMMVGRKVQLVVEKGEAQIGEEVLKVENICVKDPVSKHYKVKDVSFDLHRGEIVCIAGIDGNGQMELAQALTGLIPAESGNIRLKGEDITHFSVRKRNEAGLSHIPEDRHKFGLVLDYNIAENIVLKDYRDKKFSSRGFLKKQEIMQYAEELTEKYDIRSGQGTKTLTRSMSGGNQQKVIVARELERHHDVLVAVQPARGLDVGAIEQVHHQLIEERDKGKAVLLVSLELDEVMDVSDRILVMYKGNIVAELNPKKTTRQQLGLYMIGANEEERQNG